MGHQLCGKAIVFFGLALGGDSGDAVEEDCWCRICDNACADNVELPKLEDAGGRFRSCWRSPRVGLDGSAMGRLVCFWMPGWTARVLTSGAMRHGYKNSTDRSNHRGSVVNLKCVRVPVLEYESSSLKRATMGRIAVALASGWSQGIVLQCQYRVSW